MERTATIIEEIYKILGADFKPKIIDEPLYNIEIKTSDMTLNTEIQEYKIEKISGRVVDEKILSPEKERFSSKISSIPIVINAKIDSKIEVINDIFIKKYPMLWKDLPDEIKVKLLYEIKNQFPTYTEGLKIIGIYKDIPIDRVKVLMVDENTGILSFNLKNNVTGGNRKDLLVFKFLHDDKLRSIAF